MNNTENLKKLLITGFEDIGKYSSESTSTIRKNIYRNHTLARKYNWDVYHLDEKKGALGTNNFLSLSFPQASEVKFSEQFGWAERSDFARVLAMLEMLDLGYDVVAWLDADVFILDPEAFFDRKYSEGLHAPEEPWFNQREIDEAGIFKPVKQEQANGVLVSSAEKGKKMLALMLEIMKFFGEYGDVEKRLWAQFGPKMLTRMRNLDFTTTNDGKGPQIRETITSAQAEIGLLVSNTISIDKYINQKGILQMFSDAKVTNCNFVNMTPSSVKDISAIFEKLQKISV